MIPCGIGIYGKTEKHIYVSGRKLPEITDQSDRRDIASPAGIKIFDLHVVLALPQQDLAERFDDLGDVDALGTADIAGHAGGTDPDGLGIQEFFFEPQLCKTDDLIGQDVHVVNGRAAGGTFAALIARH
jgi:hypothetical protein